MCRRQEESRVRGGRNPALARKTHWGNVRVLTIIRAWSRGQDVRKDGPYGTRESSEPTGTTRSWMERIGDANEGSG